MSRHHRLPSLCCVLLGIVAFSHARLLAQEAAPEQGTAAQPEADEMGELDVHVDAPPGAWSSMGA